MAGAVRIPVTVKMRAGWNEEQINAPELARRVVDAGAAAVAVHGRTAKQSYSGESDWNLIAKVAAGVGVPVFGSGDCVEPEHVLSRLRDHGVAGVLVGRGALRNPWIFSQAAVGVAAGGRVPAVPLEARGRFLLEYIDLLLHERVDEARGFRHLAPGQADAGAPPPPAQGRERWVINKLRALGTWYTKGLDGGSQLRVAINSASSIPELREIIRGFFFDDPVAILLPENRPGQPSRATSSRPR
jgi:tRNA-dihydrouridine synthase B